MKRSSTFVLIFSGVSVVMGLLYQNCSENGFSSNASGSINSNVLANSTGPNTGSSSGSSSGSTGSSSGSTGSSSGGSSGSTGSSSGGSANAYIDPVAAGVLDSNCLNSNTYDACIFLKNPVAQEGAALSFLGTSGNLSAIYQSSQLAAVQKFGVKLTGLTDPSHLTSSSFYVYYSSDLINGPKYRLTLNNGQFRQSYALDGDENTKDGQKKTVAQIMAYFWLTYLSDQMKSRTGLFWADAARTGKVTNVDAYSHTVETAFASSVRSNAFFTYNTDSTGAATTRSIIMGYAKKAGATAGTYVNLQEMALSAEVYVHEMGHANLLAAAGTAISHDNSNEQYYLTVSTCSDSTQVGKKYICSDVSSSYCANTTLSGLQTLCGASFNYSLTARFCKTANGCIGGINEGQADFHYLMMFPLKTALAETIFNSPIGGFNSSNTYSQDTSVSPAVCSTSILSEGAKRDVSQVPTSWTTTNFFNGSALQFNSCGVTIPGEIHGMGSAYAYLLWSIYSDPSTDKRIFEKTFQNHLAQMGPSTNFSSAKSALLSSDAALGGKNQAVISRVFTAKGVL